VAPLLDRTLLPTVFSGLRGRGTHRAALAFLGALRRHSYALLLDMRRYFPSVDRRILQDLLARKLKDRRLLELMRVILEAGDGLYRRRDAVRLLGLEPGFPPPGCGLPIGHLTSQWWGNLYLSGLDHVVKRELKLPHAQRYMDDVACFADSRARLREARAAIREWLARERRLELKRPDAPVRSTQERFRYLGFSVSRAGIGPTPEALARVRRRLRERALQGDAEGVARSIAAFSGHVGFGAFTARGVDKR